MKTYSLTKEGFKEAAIVNITMAINLMKKVPIKISDFMDSWPSERRSR